MPEMEEPTPYGRAGNEPAGSCARNVVRPDQIFDRDVVKLLLGRANSASTEMSLNEYQFGLN